MTAPDLTRRLVEPTQHCEIDEPGLWEIFAEWLRAWRTKRGRPTTFRALLAVWGEP